jgi:hypothetical protein
MSTTSGEEGDELSWPIRTAKGGRGRGGGGEGEQNNGDERGQQEENV